MQYRQLGRSNLRVSALCLGTMMFGDQTDLDEASRIVASAREHGVNFIDTADVYRKGRSEEITGKLIAPQRDEWVLATKVGSRMSDLPNHYHYSRSWIMRAVDDSLRRLGTDYIDLYYMHRDHPGTELEEPVRAMGDLIRAGKIRAFGLSNFRGWRIAEVMRLCDGLGVPRPVACQPYYSLLQREPEVEVLPACGHYGLGVVPYSPLGRGVLTGKYLPGQEPASDSRAGRKDRRLLQTEFRPEALAVAQQLAAHCADRGIAPGHFAVAWVLAHRHVSSLIAGPRTLAQMEDYYPALTLELSEDDERLADTWVLPGTICTHGYIDPNQPLPPRR